MADIELVIKISERDLKSVKDKTFTIGEMFETTQGRVYSAIVNGTRLPKDNGDLIDRKELLKTPMNISEIDNFAKENNVCISFDFYSWGNPLISMKREDLYTERTLNMNIFKVLDNDKLILPFLKDMVEELDKKESEE